MARRATYIKENAAEWDHVLLLDAGDFVSSSSPKYELKIEYLLRGMKQMNYDAINLGERDFLLGANYLENLKEKYKLPFISANIYHSDSTKLFTEPYVIKKFKPKKHMDADVGELKVGIFGILMTRPTLVYKSDEPKLVTTNPYKAAEKMVRELENKCDVIVAIAHTNSAEINKLIDRVKGIDVVVGGHDYMRRANSANPDNVMVVQTGTKGQYIGDVKLNIDEKKQIITRDGRIMTLGKNIKDDPDIAKLVQKYRRESSPQHSSKTTRQ
ncbi:hypothetical protein GF337_12025 [candidate division KSB1 bacterium]|nr:hypothetical protein [candidate division KSB1 bacterium]